MLCHVGQVEENSVCASISQRDGMVAFHDSQTQYNDEAAIARLDSCVARAMELSERTRRMDQQLAVSKSYLKRQDDFQGERQQWSQMI